MVNFYYSRNDALLYRVESVFGSLNLSRIRGYIGMTALGSLQPYMRGGNRPQLDINSDNHQLMRNYHRPQDGW